MQANRPRRAWRTERSVWSKRQEVRVGHQREDIILLISQVLTVCRVHFYNVSERWDTYSYCTHVFLQVGTHDWSFSYAVLKHFHHRLVERAPVSNWAVNLQAVIKQLIILFRTWPWLVWLSSLDSEQWWPDKIYTSLSADRVCESLPQRLTQFMTFEHPLTFTLVTVYFHCKVTSNPFLSLSFSKR